MTPTIAIRGVPFAMIKELSMNERGISYKAIAVNGETFSLISFPSRLPTPLAAMTRPVQMTGSS